MGQDDGPALRMGGVGPGRHRVFNRPVHAPNANAFAERWVRTVRQECLDHWLIINAWYLRRVYRLLSASEHENGIRQPADTDDANRVLPKNFVQSQMPPKGVFHAERVHVIHTPFRAPNINAFNYACVS
jgi:hypothetical protein